MGQQGRTSSGRTAPGTGPGDAWTAFSYLFGGVVVYGGLGWLLDRWLGTEVFLPVGLLAGMAGSLYLVYVRFARATDADAPPDDTKTVRGDGG